MSNLVIRKAKFNMDMWEVVLRERDPVETFHRHVCYISESEANSFFDVRGIQIHRKDGSIDYLKVEPNGYTKKQKSRKTTRTKHSSLYDWLLDKA
jgi:hypothetical protein